MRLRRVQCPFCKELIVEGATKCRFCGERLVDGGTQAQEDLTVPSGPPSVAREQEEPPPSRFQAGDLAISAAAVADLNGAVHYFAADHIDAYGGLSVLLGAYSVYATVRAGLTPLNSGLWILTATAALLVVEGICLMSRKPFWAVLTGATLIAAGLEWFASLIVWGRPDMSQTTRSVLAGAPLYLAWKVLGTIGHLRRAPRDKPSEDAGKAVSNLATYLKEHGYADTPDVIEFANHTALNVAECKGALVGDVFVLMDGRDRLSFVRREHVSLLPRPPNRGDNLIAEARIGDFARQIKIPIASYERFEAWKALEAIKS